MLSVPTSLFRRYIILLNIRKINKKILRMKYILTLLVTLASLSWFSHAQNTSISGTISNTNELDSIQLRIDSSYLGFKSNKLVVPLEKGKFKFDLDLQQNEVVYLHVGKERIPLYVEPNNQIEMTFDQDSLLTNVAFAGEGGANNAIFHHIYENYGDLYNKRLMEEKIRAGQIDIFEMEMFDKHHAQSDFLDKNLDKFEHSKDFQNFIKQHVRYNYLGNLYAFPIIKANANRKQTEVNPLPKVMQEVLKEDWVNVKDAMISDQYRKFLDYYVVYKTSERNDFKKFKDYSRSVESKYVFARQTLSEKPFSYFLAKYLQEFYEKMKPSSVRWLYRDLEEEDVSNIYKGDINSLCAKKMAEEDPEEEEVAEASNSKSSGSALMKDMDGKPVSFSDFKGKVVYVDFWASWCGPCRAQFPHAAELKKKLMAELSKKQKDKIVFLYISIDDTEQGWKGAVKKMGMEGFQAHSPGGWNSKVVKQFQISGIPRYMLIDKKGNFVDQKAKRPSDPTMLDTLIELINE